MKCWVVLAIIASSAVWNDSALSAIGNTSTEGLDGASATTNVDSEDNTDNTTDTTSESVEGTDNIPVSDNTDAIEADSTMNTSTADTLIPQHGKYSAAYMSDWSKLPDGKHYPRKKVDEYSFTNLMARATTYQNQDSVNISGKYWKVKWDRAFDKYGTTLFRIKNVQKVVIENLAIIQMDPDWRASHTILIENCGEAIIRNVYLAGSVHTTHLRIEGCENVFIDNVEISGYDYGGNLGMRAGQGIYINNGEVGKGGLPSRNLKFSVVQNSYIHNYLKDPGDVPWANQDGIIVTSASDGILFNNYVENWRAGDGAIDISHRRADGAYQNHVYRIERNVFRNNTVAKTSGGLGSPSNHIFAANNVFINTYLYDYHDGYTNYWINNTFVASPNRSAAMLFKTKGLEGSAKTVYRNNLMYAYTNPLSIIDSGSDINLVDSDYNVCVMPSGVNWNAQSGGTHSVKMAMQNTFMNASVDNFNLVNGSPAINKGTDDFHRKGSVSMQVNKDFNGADRNTPPDVGAFEMGSKSTRIIGSSGGSDAQHSDGSSVDETTYQDGQTSENNSSSQNTKNDNRNGLPSSQDGYTDTGNLYDSSSENWRMQVTKWLWEHLEHTKEGFLVFLEWMGFLSRAT